MGAFQRCIVQKKKEKRCKAYTAKRKTSIQYNLTD